MACPSGPSRRARGGSSRKPGRSRVRHASPAPNPTADSHCPPSRIRPFASPPFAAPDPRESRTPRSRPRIRSSLALTTPIASPSSLTSGPPLFPGLMAASIWNIFRRSLVTIPETVPRVAVMFPPSTSVRGKPNADVDADLDGGGVADGQRLQVGGVDLQQRDIQFRVGLQVDRTVRLAAQRDRDDRRVVQHVAARQQLPVGGDRKGAAAPRPSGAHLLTRRGWPRKPSAVRSR